MRHIHLGRGRFHRAHQAYYLQRCGLPIAAFSMRSSPQLSTVTLTVTEKGYCAKADGTLHQHHPGLKDSVEFVAA